MNDKHILFIFLTMCATHCATHSVRAPTNSKKKYKIQKKI